MMHISLVASVRLRLGVVLLRSIALAVADVVGASSGEHIVIQIVAFVVFLVDKQEILQLFEG